MRLNSLSPSPGAKCAPKRLGRGIGSGLGKTSGRGHKGQKARAGGGIRRGFEGGQTPIYRRLPKFGFTSRKQQVTTEIHLSALNNLPSEVVDLPLLKTAHIVSHDIKWVKVIASGTVTRAVTLRGIGSTMGARAAIEAAGGRIEA